MEQFFFPPELSVQAVEVRFQRGICSFMYESGICYHCGGIQITQKPGKRHSQMPYRVLKIGCRESKVV